MARGKKAEKDKAKIASVEIERMPLSELTPAPYNPRRIEERNLAGLSRSVEEFGYVDLLVYNKRSGRLVSGHQRLKVLARQGVDEVDVVMVDLDDVREKALNLTLNNPAVQGEWDMPALTDVLADLRDEENAFGMFEDLRLDTLLEGIKGDLTDPIDLESEPRKGRTGAETTCPKCGFVFMKKEDEHD